MRLTSFLQSKKFNVLAKIGDLSKRFGNFPDSYIKRTAEQVYWYVLKIIQCMVKTKNNCLILIEGKHQKLHNI
jgi:hypothetical protein